MRKARSKRCYEPGPNAGGIAGQLLKWYAVHQRDLPWRRSRDPYRIWVSEVMLQQTRVDTVIPYYERWFAQFPTLESLAAAPEEQVLKAWEGLGYYSRARNLARAVREVAARYGGEVPDSPEEVAGLPGVGPYTAGAILSIAFNRSVPAVDGNVMRVLSRIYNIGDDVAQPATRQAMEELAAALIPAGQASAFNQALMELGAMLCTPTSPKCLLCPVAEFCQAREAGTQSSLPVKAKAKAPRPVAITTAVICDGGKVLIARRPGEGLLAGLWEFPSWERPAELPGERAVHQLAREHLGVEVELEGHLAAVKHVFSHLVWDLQAYLCALAPSSPRPRELENLRWVTPAELSQFAFPVAHQKVITRFMACLPSGKSVK